MSGQIGPEVTGVESAAGVVDIAISEQAVVYSKSFSLAYGEYFALAYKATSAGVVALKIELEQSYKLPATEGAADGDWCVPDGKSALNANLADEVQHIVALAPLAMKYGRLKITGLAGNATTTTLKSFISQQSN